MKLILDTHAALWWLSGDEQLADATNQERAALVSGDAAVRAYDVRVVW